MQQPPWQPRLTVWSHLWRYAVAAAVSAIVWWPVVARGSGTATARCFWVDVALGLLSLRAGVVPAPLAADRSRSSPPLLSGFSGIASGPAVLATVSMATRRVLWQIGLVGALGLVAAQFFVVTQPQPPQDPYWLSLTVNAIVERRAGGLGHVHRVPPRAAVDAAGAGRAGGGRAGAARGQGPLRRARPDRPGDARRARAPHLAGLDARRRPRVPGGPLRPGHARQRPHHPGAGQPGPARAAGRARRAPRPGDRPAARQPPADVRRPPVPAGLGPGARHARGLLDHRSTRTRRCPGPPGAPSTGSCRRGSPTPRSTPRGRGSTCRSAAPRRPGSTSSYATRWASCRTVTPGAGLGLVGLAERAQLRGGRLEHRSDGSMFVLHGWIPWAA